MTSVMAFLLVFTMVVLVHELGHFLAARAFGIPVYEFSIGFPFSPRVATLLRNRETSFTLRLLPLGGFVSFSKDGGDEASAEFINEKRWKRAVIASAGSVFNVAFAVCIIAVAFMLGKDASIIDAVLSSLGTTSAVFSGTIDVIAGLFTGGGLSENLSGPIGIASIAGKAADTGLVSLLFFTGVLSLSLGILNLLPLPALDGGHLVILALESIRGRSLTERTYTVVGAVGIAFFLILTVIVSYNDIMKLVA